MMKNQLVAIPLVMLSLFSSTALFAGGGVIAGDGYPGPGKRVGKQSIVAFPVEKGLLIEKLSKLVFYFPLLAVKMNTVLDRFYSGELLSYKIEDTSSHAAGYEVIYEERDNTQTIRWAALYFWNDFFSFPLESPTQNPEQDSQVKVVFHELIHLINTQDHELSTQRLDTLLMSILYGASPSRELIEEFRRNLHPRDEIMRASEEDVETLRKLFKVESMCSDFKPVDLTPFHIPHRKTPPYITKALISGDPLLTRYWRKCFGPFIYDLNSESSLEDRPDTPWDAKTFSTAAYQNPSLYKQLIQEILEYAFETVAATVVVDIGPIPQKTIVHRSGWWPFSKEAKEYTNLYDKTTFIISDVQLRDSLPNNDLTLQFHDIASQKPTVALFSDLASHMSNNKLISSNILWSLSVQSSDVIEYILLNQVGQTLSLIPASPIRPNLNIEVTDHIKEKFKTLSCHYDSPGKFSCYGKTFNDELVEIPLLSMVSSQFISREEARQMHITYGPFYLSSFGENDRQLYYYHPFLTRPPLYPFMSSLFQTNTWVYGTSEDSLYYVWFHNKFGRINQNRWSWYPYDHRIYNQISIDND